MRRAIIFLATATFIHHAAFAQEQIGLHFDNYAASSGMLLNPAATFASPNWWEINLVSAGAFAHNNYSYLQHQSVLSALHASMSSSVADPQAGFNLPDKVKAYSLNFVQGPSGFIKLNHFTIGIFTDTRAATAVISDQTTPALPTSLVYSDQTYEIPPFKQAAMSWSEVGLNAGMKIRETKNSSLSAAINVKYLAGWGADFFQNDTYFNFIKITHQQIVNVDRFDATYGYTSNFGNSSFGLFPPMSGKGVGADVGMIYTAGAKKDGKYAWKLGASIVDAGSIHFSRNASTYSVVSNGELSPTVHDLSAVSTLSDLNALASTLVYGNAAASQTGNDFSITLPTAAVFQVERAVGKNFYLGAVTVNRVALAQHSIYRPNMVALIPRYESKWFAATVPVELFDYNDVHAGVAVRVGPLTIGSDDFLSWVMKGKLKGSDAYVGLRIFPFGKNAKEVSASPSQNARSYHSKNKSRGNGCPSF